MGAQKMLLVRQLLEEPELAADGEKEKSFPDLRLSQTLDFPKEFSGVRKEFWLACLEELSLDTGTDRLWAFVEIVSAGGDDGSDSSLPPLTSRNLLDLIPSHARKHRQWTE